jgi:hypothetical protein
MARGETTEEYATRVGGHWSYFGGLPGDPGIVSDAARHWGDEYGLDAEELDNLAAKHGWEWHDLGYHDKIRDLAERMKRTNDQRHQLSLRKVVL